jgi:enoyl-CoA hydratase/carnithine racemase
MNPQTIKLDLSDRIARLTLNRPEKLNALNETMLEELLEALGHLAGQDGVNVVVITGAGRAYCAGVDVTGTFFMQPGAEGDLNGADFARLLFKQHRLIEAIQRLPQISIAAINGICMGGGGFGQALACDIRIASEKAEFWMVANRLAVIQDFGISWFLERLVGTAVTLELMCSGERIDGRRAAELGIVNRVVSPNSLEDAALELAGKIAGASPFSLRLIKQSVYRGLSLSLLEHLDTEAIANGLCVTTGDSREAFAAYRQNRAPVFKGR